MTTIYKYRLPLTHEIIEVEMPVGAEVLHVGEQSDNTASSLWLWAAVDPSLDLTTYRFQILGTGWESNLYTDELKDNHIGTVLTRSGFVWHVFRADD